MKQSLVALTVLLLAYSAFAQSCRFTDSANGCEYDLSALTLTAAPYYQYNDTNNDAAQGFYEVNICAPVISTCDEGSGVCQTAAGSSNNCGKAGTDFTALADAQPGVCNGVVLSYTNGTYCAQKGAFRSTDITLKCNATATTATITSVSEDDQCHYSMVMESAAACGTVVAVSTSSVSPSVSPSASVVPSASMSSSAAPSASMSSSVAPSPSMSMSSGASVSMSPSASMSASMTASASMSIGANVSTPSNASTPATVDTPNSHAWVWWLVGGIAIVVIVAAVGAAGFVVYKKKQQSYDSIGYE